MSSVRPARSVVGRLTYQMRLVAAAAGFRALAPSQIEPIAANIRLSDRCNSRCLTCRCWELKNGSQIDTDHALRLVEAIARIGIPAIRFTGGEPLLRSDLFEILHACGRAGIARVGLATNGLLLERLADQVNASPITNLSVSLDGIALRNDRIRGVPGYYDRVLRGLGRVRNKVIKVVSTITSSLVHDLENLILFCREHRYEYDVNLPHSTPYFFSGDQVAANVAQLWPSPEDVDRMVAVLSRYGILNQHLLGYAARYLKERQSEIRHCMHGYCFVGVEPDGSVNPGCYIMPVGNIHSADLGDIVRSPEYAAAVRRMFELDCRGCSCGYALSVMYERPLANLGYVRRRLRRGARA